MLPGLLDPGSSLNKFLRFPFVNVGHQLSSKISSDGKTS
jgi:hypothetical protein